MKLVAGIGINDADYPVTRWGVVGGKRKLLWRCPIYTLWHNMLHRVKSDRFATYGNVDVCEEWKTFSNFKRWVEFQDYEGMQLDKDIIDPWNKVYCPEKCLLIPARVNTLMIERRKNNSDKPNTRVRNGKVEAYVRDGYKVITRRFDTQTEADMWWVDVKIKVIEALDVPKKVKDCLKDRYGYYLKYGRLPG